MDLMSRVFAAALLLFFWLPCSYAQRGGMRSSGGGGARGFGGGHPSFGYRAAPGAHVSPSFASRPTRFASAPRSMSFADVPRSGFVHPRATVIHSFPQRRGGFTSGQINGGRFNGGRFQRARDFDGRFRPHHFHHPFLYAFPYYYSGAYFDPYYDQYWNPYYSFGSYSYDPNAGTSSYNDLSGQLGNLGAQVQELRGENESLQSELEESQRPPAPSATVSPSSSNQPATVLVFTDGHRTSIQNYAVVGQTLWILSDARATKVPLAELDLNQTIKVNEARGVEFLGPSAPQ